MRNNRLSVLIVVLLFAAAAMIACAKHTKNAPIPRPTGEARAVLELKITPPDAAIFVDGVLLGNAWDFQLLKLPIGIHIIEIRKEGYESFTGKINAGTTTLLEVELKKAE